MTLKQTLKLYNLLKPSLEGMGDPSVIEVSPGVHAIGLYNLTAAQKEFLINYADQYSISYSQSSFHPVEDKKWENNKWVGIEDKNITYYNVIFDGQI